VYPGLGGADGATPAPIASARLLLQAGSLLRTPPPAPRCVRRAQRTLGAARTSRLIRRLVRSPTDHTDDPLLLERTRREVAAALVEAVPTIELAAAPPLPSLAEAAPKMSLEAEPAIPTPSAAQLRYQETDFVALIHFNMATFAHNGDPGCDAGNWDVKAPYAAGKTRDAATFYPAKLNTSQWMESITALGADIAILTAKPGSWLTVPSNPVCRRLGPLLLTPGAQLLEACRGPKVPPKVEESPLSAGTAAASCCGRPTRRCPTARRTATTWAPRARGSRATCCSSSSTRRGPPAWAMASTTRS
jgi:hypothetical protein